MRSIEHTIRALWGTDAAQARILAAGFVLVAGRTGWSEEDITDVLVDMAAAGRATVPTPGAVAAALQPTVDVHETYRRLTAGASQLTEDDRALVARAFGSVAAWGRRRVDPAADLRALEEAAKGWAPPSASKPGRIGLRARNARIEGGTDG